MLKPGLSIEQRRTILEADCIKFLGGDVQPSLSTPAMIMAMEWVSRELAKPHLEAGQDTVGVRVEVEHLAATPLGAMVVFRSKLTEADGRRLQFEVEALDGEEVVGRGRHTRFVVDVERFAAGLRKRFAARAQG